MTMSKVCDMPLEYNGVSSEKYHPPKPFRWQLITNNLLYSIEIMYLKQKKIFAILLLTKS